MRKSMVAAFLVLTGLCCLSFSKTFKPCPDPGAPSGIGSIALKKIPVSVPSPVYLTHAGDESGKLYIVSQDGMIFILQKNKLLEKPFLNIKKKVRAGGEMGLLGLAFHPGFKNNKRFFVNYTSSRGGLHTVIAEFKAFDGLNADENSQKILMKIGQPFPNHNGGGIVFGPDGYLYIGTGDGGAANDPQNRAQNLNELLGKMLRINVDKTDGASLYSIPADNPFVNTEGARPEIWSYGMRNPWRFSFDALTKKLFAADVGQDEREEIDIIEKGKNYGWRIMEGTNCTPAVNPDCEKKGLSQPVFDYSHDEGCSVTGGYVYRGMQNPSLCGVYLFGDYCSGNIWGIRTDGEKTSKSKLLIKSSGLNISSFGEDEEGELYVLDLKGFVYKTVIH